MIKGILSGILDDATNLSDVYQTLAIYASIDDVSSSGIIANSSEDAPIFSITGESWQPPSQLLTVPDTFWITSPFKDPGELENDKMRSIADIFVGYYPPCNDQSQTRLDWRGELNNASNWKAFKGSLTLCLQTLDSSFNSTMRTTITCLSDRHGDDDFCVGGADLLEWSAQVSRSLNGSASIYFEYDNYFTGQWVPKILTDIIGETPAYCLPDAETGVGLGLEGFMRRINNIAVYMTNTLRTELKETFIDVTYYWMFLPTAIYLVITIFLFSTIFTSRKTETPLWKSSPLVLLRAMNRSNSMQKLGQVEDDAKNTRVLLQHMGDHWHPRDVSQSRY
ncbi:hypothetical protein EJ02DRAFT_477847 [Clathrospora elynae]|uniref:Uncharacterized protein n=1 Tax=Clathrospora elynae TaxID=706981 RepID=A0A6A5S8R1_9PLEO|nr:hypothetical protein EJ02DRAFT_477847 [Clathrospora elynae]